MSPYIADLTKEDVQSQPDCFARVIRFKRRDTRHYTNHRPDVIVNEGKGAGKGKNPGIRHKVNPQTEDTASIRLDIADDIISCSVNKSKGSPIGSFSMTLAAGDINYHHAIHPGDHIFIWMKRNRKHISLGRLQGNSIPDSIANNNRDSGLKLYGIVTGVRKTFRVGSDGRKLLLYQITGKDFGYFFEASIYYNALAQQDLKSTLIFETGIFGTFGAARPTDELVQSLLSAYFGSEFLETGDGNPKSDVTLGATTLKGVGAEAGRPVTENVTMFLPPDVSKVFDVPAKVFVNLLVPRIGIEKYDSDVDPDPYLFTPMPGCKAVKIDVGAAYPIWSALQAFSNPVINEMFLDLKLASDGKTQKIYPTFTFRQIPFTSTMAADAFATSSISTHLTTRFMELPRVKVPESFIFSEELGRGDHERFNYLELFGSYPGFEELVPVTTQMIMGNYAVDEASVRRYGLRTMITTSDCHFPNPAAFESMRKDPSNKEIKTTMVPVWINFLVDWYMAAHTLESGTVQMVGIEEPISIGDNLEIERKHGVNEVYHIESYSHSYSVSGDGHKEFRTSVELTRGQRIDEYPIYTSGTMSADDTLAIGLTSQKKDGMGRAGTAALNREAENATGLSSAEIPPDRKVEND